MSSNEENKDPEILLKAIKEAESKKQRGRLKVFLGMAPGVGKTYTMLETAQKNAKEGINLVVASINTHGRQETELLLKGLKIIPEKELLYKGKKFKELDIDSILKIKPQLVLVDELAHNNIPGSRHEKRWQDVLEIIDAGIDVYTTLNIQHIESYKEVTEDIAGIRIWETVPDLVVERASDVELIDITPQELLKRLREGKVYTGELSEIAAQNFFQEDRITALREIALRFTAEVVDKELNDIFFLKFQKRKEWRPREHLLVSVDHNPVSRQLIHTARRRAFVLHSPWIALYVDAGEQLDKEGKETLAKNLSLARDLGAEVVTTKDTDIVKAIIRVAQQKDITQIIIGKTKKRFKNPFKRSVIGRLLREIDNVDVLVVKEPAYTHKRKKIKKVGCSNLFAFVHISFWVALTSLICGFFIHSYQIVGLIFLMNILALSLFFDRCQIFFATIALAVIWDYFFITPYGLLDISTTEDILLLLLFFAVGTITGFMTSNIRKRNELITERERSTQAIYEIVREISGMPFSHVLKIFKERVAAVLNGKVEIVTRINGFKESYLLDNEKERSVADWVFMNGQEAGWSTTTLSSAKNFYLPLKGFKLTVGVLIFRPNENNPLSTDEINFLYTVSQQLANYIERFSLEEKEWENRSLQKVEKIYARVLNTLASELFKPLDLIKKSILDVKKEEKVLEKLLPSVVQIEKSTDALLKITENASAMAKLVAGLTRFQKKPEDIKHLVNKCTKKFELELKEYTLVIKISENLPKISFDFSLMEVLLNNLLLNAIQYSPKKTVLEIEAELINGSFVLSVSDQGPGIPEDVIHLIFEKFYRIPGTKSTGLGLGLAIASYIASIHQGEIKVHNRPTGGAKFFVVLPRT